MLSLLALANMGNIVSVSTVFNFFNYEWCAISNSKTGKSHKLDISNSTFLTRLLLNPTFIKLEICQKFKTL
jgi:hypothetical protein